MGVIYSWDVPVFQDRIPSSENDRDKTNQYDQVYKSEKKYRVADGSSHCPTFFTLLGEQSWSWKHTLQEFVVQTQHHWMPMKEANKVSIQTDTNIFKTVLHFTLGSLLVRSLVGGLLPPSPSVESGLLSTSLLASWKKGFSRIKGGKSLSFQLVKFYLGCAVFVVWVNVSRRCMSWEHSTSTNLFEGF